jgi:membrane-bound lytic murein transglycosylase MltF
MLSKLIEFLGGVPKFEYDRANARVEYLEIELKLAHEERKFLQDLIFKRFGIIAESNNQDEAENINPIRTSPRRWSQIKTAMERDDRERIKNSA